MWGGFLLNGILISSQVNVIWIYEIKTKTLVLKLFDIVALYKDHVQKQWDPIPSRSKYTRIKLTNEIHFLICHF